eukprot:17428-Chlamydomonas_euryale.AAC.1
MDLWGVLPCELKQTRRGGGLLFMCVRGRSDVCAGKTSMHAVCKQKRAATQAQPRARHATLYAVRRSSPAHAM